MQELPSYDEALRTVLDAVVCTSKTEYVPISSSLARILASDVLADRDFPPFNRSQMDGYAVRSDEIHRGVELQVVGQIPAGRYSRWLLAQCKDQLRGPKFFQRTLIFLAIVC